MPDDAADLADRLGKAYRQLDRAADLARAAHRAAVPAALPDLPPLRFAPPAPRAGLVYDAWPAGADRATAFLAHAAGHGGAAEVIGLLVRQAVAVEDLRSAGDLPPGELLARVNRLLLGLELPDPPLVSMAVARIDRGTGRVAFARAAAPPPVHVLPGGGAQPWPIPGPLLGVFDAVFPTGDGRLGPGDRLILEAGPPADGAEGPAALVVEFAV